MTSPAAFPLLSLLLSVPVLGSLFVSLAGDKRGSLGHRVGVACAAITLLLAGWITAIFVSTSGEAAIWELRTWVVSLGVSYIVGIDGLSSVLVLWVALQSLVVLLLEPSHGPRSTALVLLSEAMSLGLFLARDVFLLFAFYGGTVVTLTLFTRARRKVFVYQMAGLALLSGVFIRCYQMVFEQTGFASTELLRWRTLVLFPDAELSLFVIAFTGIVILLPLFPAVGWLHDTVEKMPVAGRLVFFGSFSLTGSYLLFRVVMPLCSRGVMAALDWFLGFAVLSLTYAAIVPGRSRARLLVGFQALVLMGLLTVRESAVVGAELQMMSVALGMVGLAIGGSRGFAAFFTLFLLGTPVVYVLPTVGNYSRVWLVLVSVAFALFASRLVREAVPLWRAPVTGRRKLLLTAPLVLWCLSMALAPSQWRAHLLPSARDFLGVPTGEAPP